jgi:fido (protein-threonine AMPylation protein)
MIQDPFAKYYEVEEPDRQEKSRLWSTAIGLQAVDGLKTSDYLIQTAIRNIEGEITFAQADALLQTYYLENPERHKTDRTQEADLVSARIASILAQKAFNFNPNEFIAIHRALFTGIYPHAGQLRTVNITKKEWVLNQDTVTYGSAWNLWETLNYDFSEEKNFSYKNLSPEETVRHLALFVSRLWQIHPFNEGNTRTTAVFFIKYLNKLGYTVTNDTFAQNAWYFRNALVRANYANYEKQIFETTQHLEAFLRNLLFKENNPLKNRYLHVSGTYRIKESEHSVEKVNIEPKKADIELLFSPKTALAVETLRKALGQSDHFGRKEVEEVLGLKHTRCSQLLHLLSDKNIIVPVSGHGKGKYRFPKQ